jgi:uncharacterized protein YceK
MNIVKVLICIVMVGLTGCGTMNSTIAGFGSKAAADARAANDNMIGAIELSICAVPIGAVLRHSEFIPIARVACLPGGIAPDANDLFE